MWRSIAFPAFTPDGKSLIFCSADSVNMPDEYRKVRYHLLRIAFDPEKGTFGQQVDTLYNARKEGRSISFPRVSPDGKRLLYAVSDYGNFSIWHRDADLRMLDLRTGETDSLSVVNSDDVEAIIRGAATAAGSFSLPAAWTDNSPVLSSRMSTRRGNAASPSCCRNIPPTIMNNPSFPSTSRNFQGLPYA